MSTVVMNRIPVAVGPAVIASDARGERAGGGEGLVGRGVRW